MRQHLFRLSIVALLATGMTVTSPARVAAQVIAPSTEAKGCKAYADVVRTGVPSGIEIESLSQCALSGGPALSVLWARHLTLSADQRRALRSSSIKLRDGRLYSAVRGVASDPSRITADRLTALQVLASYFQVNLVPSVNNLLDPRDLGPNALPIAMHTSSRDGATPLPSARMSEIPAQLAKLAWGDPDANVRTAALKLRRVLAYQHPDVTPLKPGVITLTAACGTRVVLGSKADVAVPIVLHFGDSKTYTEALKIAPPNGPPSEILLSMPPGPVVATVGGHEVARLTDRNTPCKPGQLR
jgi:hypothetical protein